MTIIFPYMARWNSANRSRWHHLFAKIAAMGHTVIVVQPPPRFSEETNYIEIPADAQQNIVLYTVPISPWLWNMKLPIDKLFKKAFYTIRSFFVLKRLTKEYQADVLVLYNIPQYLYTLGATPPIIFDFADDYVPMLQHELNISANHVVSRFSEVVLRKLLKKSSLVVAVSKVLQENIRHHATIVIPNGANPPVEPLKKGSPPIEIKKPVIGYVGAFEYVIDLDSVLAVAERMPHCSFLLVGAGRDFPRVKKAVGERRLNNVYLPGAVPHQQAMRYLAEMEVCLNIRTKSEVAHAASPIKVFEYLIHGKPIVTTRLRELLNIDEHGEMFYYADTVDEVVEQIERVLKNPSERLKKIEHGKKIARTMYTWDLLAERFIHASEQLIHKSSDLQHGQIQVSSLKKEV